MKEITIRVKGMECIGCENRIQNAIATLKTVQMVKADHEDGTVTIKTTDDSIPIIQEKIINLGFTIEDEI